MRLQIPDTVVQAIRFDRLLEERGGARHYGREEMEDALAYARDE